jgi:hypothetical protein
MDDIVYQTMFSRHLARGPEHSIEYDTRHSKCSFVNLNIRLDILATGMVPLVYPAALADMC